MMAASRHPNPLPHHPPLLAHYHHPSSQLPFAPLPGASRPLAHSNSHQSTAANSVAGVSRFSSSNSSPSPSGTQDAGSEIPTSSGVNTTSSSVVAINVVIPSFPPEIGQQQEAIASSSSSSRIPLPAPSTTTATTTVATGNQQEVVASAVLPPRDQAPLRRQHSFRLSLSPVPLQGFPNPLPYLPSPTLSHSSRPHSHSHPRVRRERASPYPSSSRVAHSQPPTTAPISNAVRNVSTPPSTRLTPRPTRRQSSQDPILLLPSSPATSSFPARTRVKVEPGTSQLRAAAPSARQAQLEAYVAVPTYSRRQLSVYGNDRDHSEPAQFLPTLPPPPPEKEWNGKKYSEWKRIRGDVSCVIKCRWKGCSARLMSWGMAESHIDKVHLHPAHSLGNDRYKCRWGLCDESFGSVGGLKDHMDYSHLIHLKPGCIVKDCEQKLDLIRGLSNHESFLHHLQSSHPHLKDSSLAFQPRSLAQAPLVRIRPEIQPLPVLPPTLQSSIFPVNRGPKLNGEKWMEELEVHHRWHGGEMSFRTAMGYAAKPAQLQPEKIMAAGSALWDVYSIAGKYFPAKEIKLKRGSAEGRVTSEEGSLVVGKKINIKHTLVHPGKRSTQRRKNYVKKFLQEELEARKAATVNGSTPNQAQPPARAEDELPQAGPSRPWRPFNAAGIERWTNYEEEVRDEDSVEVETPEEDRFRMNDDDDGDEDASGGSSGGGTDSRVGDDDALMDEATFFADVPAVKMDEDVEEQEEQEKAEQVEEEQVVKEKELEEDTRDEGARPTVSHVQSNMNEDSDDDCYMVDEHGNRV